MYSIFGTDGIRGKFEKEITLSLAKKLGYAFGISVDNPNPILIGRDTRLSGYLLLEALTKGLNAANKEVIEIGICPTPTIPFLINELGFSGGIMISASHNPPEHNGIKCFDINGKKINRDYERTLERIINGLTSNSIVNQNNKSNRTSVELIKIYEKSLISSLEGYSLEGISVILDNCHGSATSCAESIFTQLGAKVRVINNTQDGSKINVNCGSTCLEPIKKAINQFHADLGFSFDGDADRVIGIDTEGNVLDGDHILFLWGRELMKEKRLSKNILISTFMANLGLENAWNHIGGKFIRTPVGDKYIYEKMIKLNANLGGEQSGHILSNINNYCGDGLLTAIQISKFCKKKNMSLKNWLETSFSPFPQKLTNIKLPNHKKDLESDFFKEINQIALNIQEKTIDPIRIFIRPSGTENILRVLVEAENQHLVDNCSIQINKQIESIINKLDLSK
tara:strand:+ start:2594 stop:3952 length:1359 start_codon:yes stop_codon:yes gene_type:complete